LVPCVSFSLLSLFLSVLRVEPRAS
jgi:hypothetical protein